MLFLTARSEEERTVQRPMHAEALLAELSKGLETELENARVFNELEAELFEGSGSDDRPEDDGPEPVDVK